MSMNRTFFHLDVSETDHDRNYWAARPDLSAASVRSIRSAEVLLIPWENRASQGPSFPAGTTEFVRSLSLSLGDGKVAIACEPSQYQELALHGNEVRWPSVFVSALALNVLTDILADRIEKLVASSPGPMTVEMKITVENERGKCISIDYKGPPDRLPKALVDESVRCLPEIDPKKSASPAGAKDEPKSGQTNEKK